MWLLVSNTYGYDGINVRTMANAYIGVCDMCDFFIEKARLTTHLAGYA